MADPILTDLQAALTSLASEIAHLKQTGIGGTKYFPNASKYAGMEWDQAIQAHDSAVASINAAIAAINAQPKPRSVAIDASQKPTLRAVVSY